MGRENENYKSDIELTVHVSRGVLKLIGVWPHRETRGSILRGILIKLLRIICHFLLCFILIPGLLNTFLKEKDPRRRLKAIGPMCNCLMAVLKYTMFLYQGEKLEDCVTRLEEDWKQVVRLKDRRTMLEKAKIGRSIAILCVAFVYISGFSFRIIVPLSSGTIVNARNVTIRPLAFSCYFVFFDPQKTPAYEIVFAIQFMAGFVTYSITSGACSLAALYVLHACGQLEILIRRLEELVEDPNANTVALEEKLATLVRHHITVNSFLKNIEDAMQHICLVEVVGCTLILCLLGYYIIMEWENNDTVAMLTYAILLITFTFNIFIFCFIGELLTDQATKVANTSCTLEWFRLPGRTARCLILVMAMSNRPVKITAGKFLDLSLNSFGTVVRTSVAYLNMLRTTSI
ncbi:odorant receptor 22c-like isoform X9 [Vespa mandarinia]|uniref:odorant receptor 22c-like isoform X9 n=1 Tax=Vespa mandarinia TaxID=7446 RepID=UPI0016080910|nr:odorant receptor 22c-like isoform X9 [Vespa mandarinia]XP_035737309.1 odorant receptor 22c-like isoform X9 [Vespa mandarinia]